jgi:hypothetical protein
MEYKISGLKTAKNGKVSAFLVEDGYQIAKVSRKPSIAGTIQRTQFKFFSSAAEVRFENFCDSLSKSETVEALGFI